MKLSRTGSGESRLETIISYLLIAGVIISLCLELTGMVLFYRLYHNLSITLENKSLFIQEQNFFTFLYDTVKREGMQNSAVLFITLGMAVLILTPYVRVITAFIYFAWKRDFKYVLITVFVLLVITISLTVR